MILQFLMVVNRRLTSRFRTRRCLTFMFLHFSNDNSQDIATKQLCILPDTSVKAARNSLIKSLKKSPTSHVLFLNNRVFKFGHAQSAICSLCKRDNERTNHLFRQCFITRGFWDSIKSWLMGRITLLLLNQT